MTQEKRRIVFVGGIPAVMGERAIQRHFEQFARVVKVRVMKEKKTKEPKGYAFVTFAEASAIPAVIEQVHVIEGRRVDCQIASRKGEKKTWKDEQKKRRIFVVNLPGDLTSDDLQAHFSSFGEVRNAYIICDFETKVSKNYGYVEFVDPDIAARVLQGGHVAIREAKALCLPYLGRHEQKSSVWKGRGADGQANSDAASCSFEDDKDPHTPERESTSGQEDQEETEKENNHSTSDKLSKKELMLVSSLIDERWTNYRFNRSPQTGTPVAQVYLGSPRKSRVACWSPFSGPNAHLCSGLQESVDHRRFTEVSQKRTAVPAGFGSLYRN